MITGADFIQLGSKWAVLPAGEPTWRTSISRSYYGAMHTCREFFEQSLRVEVPEGPGQHRQIPTALGLLKIPEMTTAADKLDELRRMRQKADYELQNNTAGNQRLAMQMVERARDVESAIAECSSRADLPQLRDKLAHHFGLALGGWRLL